MSTKKLSPWETFKTDPDPLSKIREIKAALPSGPGLPGLYKEYQERGTVLGIPVLKVGRNVFVPRQKVIDRIEGR